MKTTVNKMQKENEYMYNFILTQDKKQLNKMLKEITQEIKDKILIDPVYTIERDFLKLQILKMEYRQLIKIEGKQSINLWFANFKGYEEARKIATFEEVKQLIF